MLLNDIVKNTPHYHPDYTELRDCLVNMQDVASTINKAKAKAEVLLKVHTVIEEFSTKDSSIDEHLKVTF